MWKRSVNGQVLHFYLAGINNQNFLMRDRETGTWWQQISGKAIFGKLKGSALELAPYDELSFGLWKKESPGGQLLAAVARDQKKYDSKWEVEVAKLPVPISFPGTELKSRDLVVGLELQGEARAYPVAAILKQSPIQDRLGGNPILVLAGPDGKSVRAFISRIDGAEVELFQKSDTKEFALIDAEGANEWNFKGCAISGPLVGKCLSELPAIKDYWFDWRNYHANTSVYRH